MKRPSVTLPAVLLISLILISCASTKDKIGPPITTGPNLPPLPTDLRTKCNDPGVRVGVHAKVELARNRAWGKCTARKHQGIVRFYDGVRGTKPKQRNK